ncbi:MAG: hypothetical protein LBK74_04500 [Treponema sp.]|jgi:hypothetical protein|nr:hypothetical protein [Treponema sp.]
MAGNRVQLTAKKELKIADGKDAYYNRIRMHLVLDYVAPNVFKSGQAA